MFGALQGYVVTALWLLMLAVKLWAFIDCLRWPTAAFPAVSRQTKVLWLILTAIALLVGFLPGSTLGFLGIAGTVVALVYLFDVRPRLQEITGRR